jgi:PhnB protein
MAKKAPAKKKTAVKPVAKKVAVKAKKAPPAKTKPIAAKSAPIKKAAVAAKPATRPAAAPSPGGRQSVTPYLSVRGASHAIEFYRRAFGAQELFRMPSPDGYGIMHADLMIGNCHIHLADEMPQSSTKSPQSIGGSTVSIMLYVDDVDQVYKQALEAGATSIMEPADMFWGDRFGKVLDPFGHDWSLATHKEDVSPAEMESRFKAFLAKAKP